MYGGRIDIETKAEEDSIVVKIKRGARNQAPLLFSGSYKVA